MVAIKERMMMTESIVVKSVVNAASCWPC